ncbi:MAG: NlpC/P60 family protein [Actinobacteria bacterium]|nr:NlpC/P60 family protein [Actinomycetota bacterium]
MRHCHRWFAVVAVTLATSMVFAGGVGAQSLDDKRAQAAALADAIEASDVEMSRLAENLNAATARRDAAQAQVAEAEAMMTAAREEVKRIKAQVRANAAALYREHSSGAGSSWFEDGDPSELVSRDQYSAARAEADDDLLGKLKAAQQDLEVRRQEAARLRDAAAAETAAIDAAAAAVNAARAEQQRLYDQISGEIAAAVAAEQARRGAAARAKFSGPNVGPPNGSAAQAIAYARGLVGAPYSTSPRTGPSYDCSGLTLSAWGAAGVSIGNNSSNQFSSNVQIPLAAVQPGDLIFWGPDGSSHVALYVGGGMIIDASSSQNAVMERPIWGSPSGAARVV